MAVARSKFLLPWLEDARNIGDMKLEWNPSMSLSGLQSHLISCDPSAARDSLMKLAYVGGRGRPPLRCHSLFYPPYKVSPRVTEGWLNDTEMLIEASKMHPAAG